MNGQTFYLLVALLLLAYLVGYWRGIGHNKRKRRRHSKNTY